MGGLILDQRLIFSYKNREMDAEAVDAINDSAGNEEIKSEQFEDPIAAEQARPPIVSPQQTTLPNEHNPTNYMETPLTTAGAG